MSIIITKNLLTNLFNNAKFKKTLVYKVPADFYMTKFIKQELRVNEDKFIQIGEPRDKIFFNPVKNEVKFE